MGNVVSIFHIIFVKNVFLQGVFYLYESLIVIASPKHKKTINCVI